MLVIETYGFDSYNQTVELETAQPLRSHGGGDEMPKVMIVQSEPIAFKDDITVKFDGGGVAFALDTMHRQQLILVPMEKHDDFQNESLLRGGVKQPKPSTAHTTKEPAHETERSVRYWQKNLFI